MSSDEQQSMHSIRIQLTELQAFLNPGTVLEAKQVGDYLDQLIAGGVAPGIAEFNIKQWQEVNKVTTEYDEFDQNCTTALAHLSQPANPTT